MIKKITTVAAVAMTLASSNLFAQTFTADANKTSIEWLAKKVTGKHDGEVKLTSGTLTLEKDAVKAGSFEVNMTTISNKDLTGEWHDKLIGHLKSDDFFSTEKHPKATLVVKEGKKGADGSYTIKGDLTIKGITKPITFPATITVAGNTLTANASITIDRTLYDIRYGSKSFFANIGDKAIDNDFLLTVKLVATK